MNVEFLPQIRVDNSPVVTAAGRFNLRGRRAMPIVALITEMRLSDIPDPKHPPPLTAVEKLTMSAGIGALLFVAVVLAVVGKDVVPHAIRRVVNFVHARRGRREFRRARRSFPVILPRESGDRQRA